MSKSMKLGALAISAFALSLNVSATTQTAKDSLQSSLLTYMSAVKDSSSLTVYSAVEFEGLTSQTNCYTPGDYTNYPELGAGSDAEICYDGVINPEDGTKYIAYSPTNGYTVVFKDNLLNHVIVPVGAEGQFGNESSVKLRVSQSNKTPNSQNIFCENDYDQAVRCNAAYVVIAAKETQTDMNAALDSLYSSVSQVASVAVSDDLTVAINAAEDAQMLASQAQLTADQAVLDAGAASTKVDSVKSELDSKISNNKSAVADVVLTASNALSKSNTNANGLSSLSNTVSGNTTDIGNKVDSAYVNTAIANQNLPDFASLIARMDAIDAKNAELEIANAELAKKVPVASVVFDGVDCPGRMCPIISGYGISKIEQIDNTGSSRGGRMYRLFFETPLNDSMYSAIGQSTWLSNKHNGLILSGYSKYPKTKDSFVLILTGVDMSQGTWQSPEIEVIVNNH